MDKKWLTPLIDGMGLRPHVDAARRQKTNWYESNWYREHQTRIWISRCRKQKALVHASVEVTGHLPSRHNIEIGSEVHIERDATIWLSPDAGADPVLKLGSRVFIGRNTYIGAYQPITIGTNTIIGAYSYLISGNHRSERRDVPMRDQGFVGASIVIADDVWIGTHVVVLPGVTIGKGAIVAAGSIVSKDIPSYEIWGGVPAKHLKHRPDQGTQAE